MRNKFNRAPEFIEVYRNLSAHTSKALEDAASFQIMRTMVGLNQWFGGLDCNFSIPSEAEVRTVLQMSYQERKIEVNFANGSTNIDEMIPIGEFEVNRGLSLLPLYENSNLPGQSFSPCVQCTCQNIGKHT